MRIGDRCFVHGYVDEIRKDTIIIRNKGGYFGTNPGEVIVVNDTEIDKQPTVGGWIPCSKRLPREEEQDDELGVLVTLGNGYSGLQCDWYHGDHWYDWDGFVIAWMPLPKPWK